MGTVVIYQRIILIPLLMVVATMSACDTKRSETESKLESLPSTAPTMTQVKAGGSQSSSGGSNVSQFVAAGPEEEEAARLGKMVANGEDLTPIGFSWAHSSDRTLALRMYLKISRYLLAHLDEYDGQKRKNVEDFLCNGGYRPTIQTFSRTAVEIRLVEIEDRIKRIDSTSR